MSRADIARVFPDVIAHTERPILRTAPAPLFLLSKLVHDAGIKVVLTGEGADEMFAGYDLFREAKVRRFWAREPDSTWRPRLIERLYPYLARSPVSQRAMSRQFFGQQLGQAGEPGFGHDLRWRSDRGAAAPVRSGVRAAQASHRDVRAELLGTLPDAFRRWTPLAQDQYLEVRTLLVRLPAVVAGRPHADGPLGRGALPVPRSPGCRARRIAAAGLQAEACSTRSTSSSVSPPTSSRRRF